MAIHAFAATENDAFERCARLGRGINLGNAMEMPRGRPLWEPQPEHLDLIKAAGFNSIRIPIRWSEYAATDAPFAIDPAWFTGVDTLVNAALDRKLAVVINVHHFNELMADPVGQHQRFLAIWNGIAEHYREFGPDLFFELLNEPHGKLRPQLWNELLSESLAVVRRSNPNRAVIVGTAPWGGVRGLKDLVMPEGDRNLILTVHYYEPYHFTHQGASWANKGADAWLGTTWDGTRNEQRAIRADFDQVAAWAKEHRRPVYLGEFGAYNKADMESRARWTDFVAREAEKRGMSWAYWEACSGYGAYDPKAGAWREPLLRALMPSATGR
ncbi:MAG: glycoside hydrolase family 5 protein [Candidatus Hydrogenedentes bacterium]|nr:glycoside hydrolase family 5 protein [Candidatus Hydrogenedentota bacterium]